MFRRKGYRGYDIKICYFKEEDCYSFEAYKDGVLIKKWSYGYASEDEAKWLAKDHIDAEIRRQKAIEKGDFFV
jgi:hypothetical protein